MKNLPFLTVCLAYLGLSFGFLQASPPLEATDEAGHMNYILRIKQEGRLPIASLKDDRIIGAQELTQPPLYYLLGTLLISGINISDSKDYYHFRPESPVGRADLPGAKNMWQPVPKSNFFPEKTRLAIVLLRGFSMLLGLGTLVITYGTAKHLFGETTSIEPGKGASIFSAALIAFNPMFLFIANSVNNDNLVIFLTSAGICLLLRAKGRHPSGLTDMALGLIAGLAVISKLSGLVLVPVVLYQITSRKTPLGDRLKSLALFVFPVLLTCGWWVAFNLFNYREALALDLHALIANNSRSHTEPLALFREWSGFLKSYWGVFGAFNIIYPDEIYYLFYCLTAGLFGCAVIYLMRYRKDLSRRFCFLVLMVGLNFLAVLWWTSHLTGSQGRLLFPSIGAISILFATGIFLLPKGWQKPVYLAISGGLMAIAVYGAWWVIPHAYL
jgi:4-amino-4-deoxy-L-arabinose transferase-like glycosyltransferase